MAKKLLKRYEPGSPCPKCGSYHLIIVWQLNSRVCQVIGRCWGHREHLHIACNTCGHERTEAPADTPILPGAPDS